MFPFDLNVRQSKAQSKSLVSNATTFLIDLGFLSLIFLLGLAVSETMKIIDRFRNVIYKKSIWIIFFPSSYTFHDNSGKVFSFNFQNLPFYPASCLPLCQALCEKEWNLGARLFTLLYKYMDASLKQQNSCVLLSFTFMTFLLQYETEIINRSKSP